MVWKRARRPFAGGAGSRRRAPGFERHDSRPAFPRAAEHGNGRHHAKGRRTDPPQGDFQGVGRSGAQGKGVAGRIRPHWIRPATPFWFPWCAGRGSRGVPPPGVEPGASQRRKQRRYRWGLGRVREGKDLGAPVGPCGGSWGTVRRTGPRSGSSDHSSEPSVSAGAFALRRRETTMRAAPPPSTTTAASAISAMPAPVWARVLR
ncbi:hypothetical protein MCC10025_1093 [Bifidobacterium longum subsp. longum]|nr:hypothetical protein MCC10025_1093 [Bifidobacterium longum subsp. longum]